METNQSELYKIFIKAGKSPSHTKMPLYGDIIKQKNDYKNDWSGVFGKWNCMLQFPVQTPRYNDIKPKIILPYAKFLVTVWKTDFMTLRPFNYH